MGRCSASPTQVPCLVALVAVGGAVLAAIAAYYFYIAFTDIPENIRRSVPAVRSTLEHKYFFDEAYDGFASTAVVKGSEKILWKDVDSSLIDGTVNGIGRLTRESNRIACSDSVHSHTRRLLPCRVFVSYPLMI